MDQLEKAANSSASSIEPAEKAAVAPALQASPAPQNRATGHSSFRAQVSKVFDNGVVVHHSAAVQD